MNEKDTQSINDIFAKHHAFLVSIAQYLNNNSEAEIIEEIRKNFDKDGIVPAELLFHLPESTLKGLVDFLIWKAIQADDAKVHIVLKVLSTLMPKIWLRDRVVEIVQKFLETYEIESGHTAHYYEKIVNLYWHFGFYLEANEFLDAHCRGTEDATLKELYKANYLDDVSFP